MGIGGREKGKREEMPATFAKTFQKHPHVVLGILFILWSVIQLNRAFGLKGGVHIQLTRIN